MKYSFFKIKEGQKYEVELQVVKGKIRNNVVFNFPITDSFPAKNHNKGLIKIIEHIDFSSLDNTITKMEASGFQYIVSSENESVDKSDKKETINYVGRWMEIYKAIIGIDYLMKDKEAVMLVQCLREMPISEATQLFNIFLVSNDWWADVKSIGNFVKNINQVRLVIVKPKTTTQDLKQVAKTVNLSSKTRDITKFVTEYSLTEFEKVVLKYNTDTKQNLTNEQFMLKYGYQILGEKIIKT